MSFTLLSYSVFSPKRTELKPALCARSAEKGWCTTAVIFCAHKLFIIFRRNSNDTDVCVNCFTKRLSVVICRHVSDMLREQDEWERWQTVLINSSKKKVSKQTAFTQLSLAIVFILRKDSHTPSLFETQF